MNPLHLMWFLWSFPKTQTCRERIGLFYSFAILVTPGWILGCFCIQSVAVSPSYASMLVNEGKGQLLVELGEFSPHGAPERISGTLSVLGTTLRATGVADVGTTGIAVPNTES